MAYWRVDPERRRMYNVSNFNRYRLEESNLIDTFFHLDFRHYTPYHNIQAFFYIFRTTSFTMNPFICSSVP